MSTSILFVCTYWGVRSQIASLLANALQVPGVSAHSAGFETGTIGDLPRQLMSDRGLHLPAESPDTLFKHARNKADYDYVVTLCNQHTQENYAVLYSVVDMLFGSHAKVVHWNIPDFMSINATGDARKAAAEEIVAMIDHNVRDFVGQIRPQSAANENLNSAV